jgi:hypothetical protein
MRQTLASGLALALLVFAAAPHVTSAQEASAMAESSSPARATGTFDGTVSPLASVEEPAGLTRGRSSRMAGTRTSSNTRYLDAMQLTVSWNALCSSS